MIFGPKKNFKGTITLLKKLPFFPQNKSLQVVCIRSCEVDVDVVV